MFYENFLRKKKPKATYTSILCAFILQVLNTMEADRQTEDRQTAGQTDRDL